MYPTATEPEIMDELDDAAEPELDAERVWRSSDHGVPAPTPRPTLDAKLRAQALLQDPARLAAALTQLWLKFGQDQARAEQLARTRQVPHWSGQGQVTWIGDSEQLALLIQHRCLPAMETPTEPEPTPNATPSATVPVEAARVERDGADPVVQPAAVSARAPLAPRAPERASALKTAQGRPTRRKPWFDLVPKRIIRDRHVPAQAALLFALMLDTSDWKTKVTYTSQAKLARYLGLGKGGRNQVRASMALLEARGYIEKAVKVVPGGRDWLKGHARRWRVVVAERPLAPEDDRRGLGLA